MSSKSVAESKEGDDCHQIGSGSNFKPGQKYPTPSPGSGERVFYETLFQQKPESVMAKEWCLAYGILDWNVAEQLYKLGGGIKKVVGKANVSGKNNNKAESKSVKRAKIINEDDIAADTGFVTFLSRNLAYSVFLR